jgi:alkanesulfonate monooxygenase SsuD/methylene tetrahydromethanopterin reductase-like flavin-dependent oxidoreductase (luciferase family)
MSIDAVDAVLALWADPQPGAYAEHGWAYTVPEPNPLIRKHVWLKPFQQPHPPIAVAGVTERSETLGLAGERGWIPMSINFVTARVLRGHWDSIEAGAARTGRVANRGDWRICRAIHVAETDALARQQALEGAIGRDYRDYFLPLLSTTRGLGGMKIQADMSDTEITLDYLCDNLWLVGSPETVARKIRDLHTAVGGFGGLLIGATDWDDAQIWERSMSLFAAEVIPRLSDLSVSTLAGARQ